MTVHKTELATPALADMLDFWLRRCDGGAPPRAGDLSPVDLRPWKDHLVVFEVAAEDIYVYTYYGAALVEAFGQSRLGATLDELPDSQRNLLASEYATVIAERLPAARTHTAEFNGRIRSFERLVLPLRGDGETVDKLLAAAYEIIAAPQIQSET